MKMNRELTKTERRQILRNYLKSITMEDFMYTLFGLFLLVCLSIVFSVGCVVFG